MHGFPGHIAMDQRLGQPLRKIGRSLKRPQPRRERNGPGPLRPERHPHMPPPDLITGPLNNHPPRRNPRAQPRPNPSNGTFLILPKHIGSPHQHQGPAHRHLKPPVHKRKPVPLIHLGGSHALGLDLHPHHPHPGRHPPKPPQQLHSSPRCSPKPKINSHTRTRPPQSSPMRSHDPPIHPPQPIRIGGPTSDRTHGTSSTGGHTHEDMGGRTCATASRGRTGGCPPAAAGVRPQHSTSKQNRPTEDGYPPGRPRPTTNETAQRAPPHTRTGRRRHSVRTPTNRSGRRRHRAPPHTRTGRRRQPPQGNPQPAQAAAGTPPKNHPPRTTPPNS